MPLSKYDRHVSYYCKKQQAECPLCFEKYRMDQIADHMTKCEVEMRDPEMVTCKFCKQKMHKSELKDHAIAHTIEQKQVERSVIQRIADIEDFFEEEKLETESDKVPVLEK